MEHEISAITGWLNASLGGLTGEPWHFSDQAVIAFTIVFASAAIFPAWSRHFSLHEPGIGQQMMEIGVNSVGMMLDSFIGQHGRRYFPLMGAFAFFILMSNLLAFIPGFQPPTADLNTTVALATVSFLAYNLVGIRTHGMAYAKQFVGEPLWLAPLMIPIEILSHLARPLSLSLRLFGNIFGEHTLAAVFFNIAPLGIGLPVIFAPLGVFVSFMQTFVFCMLSMIYIAGALEHGH